MEVKSTPQNTQDLLLRADSIAGQTLQELADAFRLAVPQSMAQAKGWVGQLIERHLGAVAGNKPEPDFLNLGIELKTLPYNAKGEPQESTYVCTAPLTAAAAEEEWHTSRLRAKLAHVLWIPVEADRHIPLPHRKIGAPLLLKLDPQTEMMMRQDWEELMEMLHLGHYSKLSAHHGTYLQIRPKAAHSRILRAATNSDGALQWVGPRGFYLRTNFTRRILKEHYCSIHLHKNDSPITDI